MSTVRTVLGVVDAGELGITCAHEHLVTAPGDAFRGGDADLVLDDERAISVDLEAFALAGGSTIVELSVAEFGRDPLALARLSAATGVRIIAATGHVVEAQWAGVLDVGALSERELVREMVRDITEGFQGADGVGAGVIKVGTSRDGATPAEERVLRAAAAAQRETGAGITTHTTAGTAGLEQIRVLEAAGADLDRVCIGHQDHRLVWDDHLAIVRAGCLIGYDQVGKEKYARDHDRAAFIARLVAAGFGERIVLSHDFARRSDHLGYGGAPGLPHILESFVPLLRAQGLSEADVERLLVANPAALLAPAPARA
jgi:phosphotriesterase-related protein